MVPPAGPLLGQVKVRRVPGESAGQTGSRRQLPARSLMSLSHFVSHLTTEGKETEEALPTAPVV